MWVAAAAGVVLLVAGCGEGGSGGSGGSGKNKGGGSSAGSSAGSTGGGAETGGGDLDAAAVTKEITDAATAAGFTQDASGDAVPAELKACMVTWTADAEKAADPKKSYTDTLATLTKGGWKEGQSLDQNGSTIKTLAKSNWQVKASNHSAGPVKLVMFVANETGAECEALFKADLEKNKKS
ncbi:hypothetical protein [Streptomyces vilmorinianum]|uniref:hypothetical protein n=1 Tax=Streptomyces vilmorinianum TaxID=3051092 RepID=UPI0020C82B90|nr:hypothetical protein [Streptomyces vilmorinianum]